MTVQFQSPKVSLRRFNVSEYYQYDHTVKLPLYARAGIPAVWLADLEAKNLTSYLDPSPEGYRQVHTNEPGDAISLYGLPGLQITVSDVIKK